MIKHCRKFHFRIFRHGFLIPKHVRAGRHGILAPALKAETSMYQFLLFDLSASWFVGELDYRRVRLSASWCVGELVCRRVRLSAIWFVGELSSYLTDALPEVGVAADACGRTCNLWPHCVQNMSPGEVWRPQLAQNMLNKNGRKKSKLKQAVSARECPLCRQRHLSNIFLIFFRLSIPNPNPEP